MLTVKNNIRSTCSTKKAVQVAPGGICACCTCTCCSTK